MQRLLISLLLLIFATAAQAQPRVQSLRIGEDKTRTRLVLELSDKVAYSIFTLDNPRRVVLDLPPVAFPDINPSGKGIIAKLRFGQFNAEKSRVVLDLARPAEIASTFLLDPSAGFPHRLVVDLQSTDAASFAKTANAQRASTAAPKTSAPPPRPPKRTSTKLIIVLDAGHGGVDPGALGRKAREKNVTLAFVKELGAQLKASKKYQVHYTRTRDIYIPLRQRVDIARRQEADLFISIHADAIARKNVRGLSVYTLSEKASDKEAAALARKENQSDIIAGIDFADTSPEVANILLDLAQRGTKNDSVKFAQLVTKHAKKSTTLLERPHRFAGFRVLKAPDVPSVLVELGFLTNRNDEKQLQSAAWRKRIAKQLKAAIDEFFIRRNLATTR